MKISKDIYLVGGGDIRLSSKIDSHVYLVDGGTKRCLIDTGGGTDQELILENIRSDGFNLDDIDFILITHAHADHAGGAYNLKKQTNAELFAPVGEADFIEHGGVDFETSLRIAQKNGIYPEDYIFKHVKIDRVVTHNQIIKVGKYTIRAIQVSGHSEATTAYLIEDEPRSLFSSDIVFIEGTVGFGNWPGCDLQKYRNNIGRLSNLNVTSLFPGHFMWTLKDGQQHLDRAIKNFEGVWLPPAWMNTHPHK